MMSIKDKLDVINFICEKCHNDIRTGDKRIEQHGDCNIMDEEERFSCCKKLRDRVNKIDIVFNTVYGEDLLKIKE